MTPLIPLASLLLPWQIYIQVVFAVEGRQNLVAPERKEELHKYSHSHLGAVVRYIQDQVRHHQRKTFREEYTRFLKKFEASYDARFIFAPLD